MNTHILYTFQMQFCLSPQYGIGHFISIHSSDLDLTESGTSRPHPMSFQVYLVDSSIICPKSSKSEELIALQSPKIILSNSYEKESFSLPTFSGSNEKSGDDLDDLNHSGSSGSKNVHYSDSDQHDSFGYACRFVDSIDSVIFEDSDCFLPQAFDPSSILRMNVSAEDVRIFTGLPSENREAWSSNEDSFYIARYLEIGEISEGSPVFNATCVLSEELFPMKKRVSQLRSRKWEEITLQPVQLEVLADFLPSNLRVLIKDQITFDGNERVECSPFSVSLRMSQFYALMSTWYGNMQELPMLFPYSPQSILEHVEVPPCPSSWPEYGTKDYVDRMSCDENKGMEIAVSFAKLMWHCSFDHPDYFPKRLGCAHMFDSLTDGISLESEGVSLMVDFDIENFMRVGCASRTFRVQDFRSKRTLFEQAFCVPHSERRSPGPVDMKWGLNRDMTDLTDDLNLPFQLTVFMTPDRWCLVNVGIAELDSCSHDLAFFWIFMEYFSAYFLSYEFGNPFFDAERKRIDYLKQCNKWEENEEPPCLNLDVRLWLPQPRIAIPSNPVDSSTGMLVLKSQLGGIFYRYKTIGSGFYSQNVVTRNMEMLFSSDASKTLKSNVRILKNSDRTTQFLAKGLNLNVNYDLHIETNHMNVSVSSSTRDHSHDGLDGIESSSSIQVAPLLLSPPTVCNPRFRFSKRSNSESTCDITISPEYLKQAGDLLYKFVGPFPPEDEISDADVLDSSDGGNLDQNKELSFSVTAKLTGIRLIICEPVLGMHLPIANVCISDIQSSVSHFKFGQDTYQSENTDFQACADAQLWVDYYKSGPTRSWEPFLEPYKCTILYEKSSRRGQGITVNSECPLHLNISGAFLETLDFATDSLFNSVFKVFEKNEPSPPSHVDQEGGRVNTVRGQNLTRSVKEELAYPNGDIVTVTHEKVATLRSQERVAFSLINLSGHRLRFHQQTSKTCDLSVGYLDHLDVTALPFPATCSVFRNLEVVEVSAEGLGDGGTSSDGQVDSSNFINVQIPGMHWCRGICVDKTGKRFISLQPRSDLVRVRSGVDGH